MMNFFGSKGNKSNRNTQENLDQHNFSDESAKVQEERSPPIGDNQLKPRYDSAVFVKN